MRRNNDRYTCTNATHDHRFQNDLKNTRLTILRVRLTTIEDRVLQLQFYRSIIIIVSLLINFFNAL